MSIIDLQTDQQPLETQQLKARMLQIQEQLVTKTPELPNILYDIHKILQDHEELTHLLDDEDMSRIHKGFELHKGQQLLQKEIEKATKKGAGSKKKLSQTDLDNL